MVGSSASLSMNAAASDLDMSISRFPSSLDRTWSQDPCGTSDGVRPTGRTMQKSRPLSRTSCSRQRRSLRALRRIVRSMVLQSTEMADVLRKSVPMPKEDKLTSLSTFFAFIAPITFWVPSEHHRSIEGCRFPRQLMTASAPSMAPAISSWAESLAISILRMVSSILARTSSVFFLRSRSSTSTSRPLSVPSLLDSMDRATWRTLYDGSRVASVMTNLPTSPMPPLVAYRMAIVLVIIALNYFE
mmetsp:Transcript_6096/g.12554  ORF Transcript_6096/g.12554 Transcript_6096/m.12554 type:complete len:244 (+) Transcript_6096:238-969(+)